MKETIRTASVLEIYNASIVELNKQKNELVLKLDLLRASKTGTSIFSIILYVILSLIILFMGLASILYLTSSS